MRLLETYLICASSRKSAARFDVVPDAILVGSMNGVSVLVLLPCQQRKREVVRFPVVAHIIHVLVLWRGSRVHGQTAEESAKYVLRTNDNTTSSTVLARL